MSSISPTILKTLQTLPLGILLLYFLWAPGDLRFGMPAKIALPAAIICIIAIGGIWI